MKPCFAVLILVLLLPWSVWHGISDVSLTWQLVSVVVQGIVWLADSVTDRDIFQDEETWVPVIACLSWNIVILYSVVHYHYYRPLPAIPTMYHLYQYSFLATLPPLTAHNEYKYKTCPWTNVNCFKKGDFICLPHKVLVSFYFVQKFKDSVLNCFCKYFLSNFPPSYQKKRIARIAKI